MFEKGRLPLFVVLLLVAPCAALSDEDEDLLAAVEDSLPAGRYSATITDDRTLIIWSYLQPRADTELTGLGCEMLDVLRRAEAVLAANYPCGIYYVRVEIMYGSTIKAADATFRVDSSVWEWQAKCLAAAQNQEAAVDGKNV